MRSRNLAGRGRYHGATARFLLSISVLTLILPSMIASPAAAAGPVVGIASSVENVRPTGVNVAALPKQAALTAARNESESFQIVIAGPATNVSVSGDPFGWGTTELSRVEYYTAIEQSDLEGGTGRWGDALIPDRDVMYNQKRTAFPLNVPTGENRVVWVDVHVPANATAGTTVGSLSVTSTQGAVNIPVTMRVLGFTLPSTSSMRTAFYMQGDANLPGQDNPICRAHTNTGNCSGNATTYRRLTSLYTRLALDNRITIANGSGLSMDQAPQAFGTDWDTLHRQPILDAATTVPTGAKWRLPGAQATSVSQFAFRDWHCKGVCAGQWSTKAAEPAQTWDDRFVWYACDEPGNTQSKWNTCAQYARPAWQGWNRSALVTSTIAQYNAHAAAANMPPVSTLVAPLYGANDARGIDGHRSEYNTWLAADRARQLWLYSACDAAGCSGDSVGSVHDYLRGWPSYAIDAPANQRRAGAWMVRRFGASGELNWAVHKRLAAAWTAGGQFDSGVNGDGTYFYPGTVARIGGTNDIPLASIRLKQMRDGQEDYEYMKWLSDQGRSAKVDTIVAAAYPNANSATAAKDGTGAGSLLAARQALIAEVDSVLPPPAVSGTVAFAARLPGASYDIWIADAANGANPKRLTNTADDDRRPAWGPGGLIAFNRGDDIWLMKSDGTGQRNISGAIAEPVDKPAWSLDGSTLYHVRRVAGHDEIWSMRTDGTGSRSWVTYKQNGANAYDPAVAGDGRVYYSLSGDIYRFNPATGVKRAVLVGTTVDEVPDIGNYSSLLAVSRAADPNAAYRTFVPATGRSPGGLTQSLHGSFGMRGDTYWTFAAQEGAGGRWRVYVRNLADTDRRVLTAATQDSVDPDWNWLPTTYAGPNDDLADATAPVVNRFVVPATSAASTVAVDVMASDDVAVTQMRFATENGNWRAWQPYDTRATVALTPGSGLRGVYVQVRDGAGRESVPVYRKLLVTLPSPSP